MEDIINNSNKDIKYAVSPYLELLSVIQLLSIDNNDSFKDWYANNEYYINEIKKI